MSSLKSKLSKRNLQSRPRRIRYDEDAPEKFAKMVENGQFTDVEPSTLKAVHDALPNATKRYSIEHFKKKQEETRKATLERNLRRELLKSAPAVPETHGDVTIEDVPEEEEADVDDVMQPPEQEPIPDPPPRPTVASEYSEENALPVPDGKKKKKKKKQSDEKKVKFTEREKDIRKKIKQRQETKKEERKREIGGTFNKKKLHRHSHDKFSANEEGATEFHVQEGDDVNYGGKRGKGIERVKYREKTGIIDPLTGVEEEIEYDDLVRTIPISKKAKPNDLNRIGVSLTEEDELKEVLDQIEPGDFTNEELNAILKGGDDYVKNFYKRIKLAIGRRHFRALRDEFRKENGLKPLTKEQHEALDLKEGLGDDADPDRVIGMVKTSKDGLTPEQRKFYMETNELIIPRPIRLNALSNEEEDFTERFLELHSYVPFTMLQFTASLADYIERYEETASNLNVELISQINVPLEKQKPRRLYDIVDELRKWGAVPCECAVKDNVYIPSYDKKFPKVICLQIKYNTLDKPSQKAILIQADEPEILVDPGEIKVMLFNRLHCNIFYMPGDDFTESKLDAATNFCPILDINWYTNNEINSLKAMKEAEEIQGTIDLSLLTRLRAKILCANMSLYNKYTINL